MGVLLARCAALWTIVTSVTAVAAHVAVTDVRTAVASGAVERFDTLVPLLAMLALAACAGWAWMVCTVVVVSTVRDHGRRPRVAPRGVPVWAYRLVLAGCGAALVGAAQGVPAQASPDPRVAGIAAVAGLPLPDRTTGPLRTGRDDELGHLAAVGRIAAATTASAAGDVRDGRPVTVLPGDSLWRIAERLLGPGAGVTEVAFLVHELHDLNRAAIGADPDLIHPGHQLRTPRRERPPR